MKLMKFKKRGENSCLYFSWFCFLKIFCYEVFVKQKKEKRSAILPLVCACVSRSQIFFFINVFFLCVCMCVGLLRA